MTLGDPPYWQIRNLEKVLNADVLKKAQARNSTVPWIKDFVAQRYDPEWSELDLSERGLMQELRRLAATRGNKIPNDEAYLRRQVGCTSRTRLATKLLHLRTLGFIEPYNEATNTAAKQLFPSHIGLYDDENETRLDVEVELPPIVPHPQTARSPLAQSRPNERKPRETTNGRPTTHDVTSFVANYCIHLPDEDVVRDELSNRFHLDEQALDEAQEQWRQLRAQTQGGAST